MKITDETLQVVEKALNLKLYEEQKQYLIHDGSYWFGGRQSGKTLAYCIKLALSDGGPLNMKKPIDVIDSDYGTEGNKRNYSLWFKKFFLEIWQTLKAAGLPVRKVID